MAKQFKNYDKNPNASDIVAMDDDVGDIGLIRITDDDDIDIIDAFSNEVFDVSDPCKEKDPVPSETGPWQLVGIKKGASWKEDSLTFDDFDTAEKTLSTIYDASRGTIDGYGTFPYSRRKCQGFAANMAAHFGGREGSPWLTEAGDEKYAQFIIGFPAAKGSSSVFGSHPWGDAGNWKDGHVLSDSFYRYHSMHYAGSYVENIGSKSTDSSEQNGIPKLSADVLWIDDGEGNGSVELFKNSSATPTMIKITEDEVIIDTTRATADGSIHTIDIAGMTNKDASDNPNVPGSATLIDVLNECEEKIIEVLKLKRPSSLILGSKIAQTGIRG
mgnify:CR=1 FL=1|jgi:hypothetical protein